jgi:hypothetical protein
MPTTVITPKPAIVATTHRGILPPLPADTAFPPLTTNQHRLNKQRFKTEFQLVKEVTGE